MENKVTEKTAPAFIAGAVLFAQYVG